MYITEQEIENVFPEICAVRRTLHETPEPGTQEFETGKIIVKCLEKWGIPYKRIADTGFVAMIEGKKECPDAGYLHGTENTSEKSCPSGTALKSGNVVALRADMDALPIEEDKSHVCRSKNPGYMHACGHDAHTAILLGTALLLKKHENDWSGTIKCFFQPAEETQGGAKRMIEAGCMQNPTVDYVAGLHMNPQYYTGEIEVKPGKMNASSDEVIIDLYGHSCHGAYPEKGTDAALIAATLLLSLQTFVSRSISPLNSAVLSFGMMHGGTAPNIVCDHMQLHGTLRVLDEATRTLAHQMIRTQAQSIAAAYGGNAEVTFVSGYDALINPEDLTVLLAGLASQILGTDHVHYKEFPSLGVEDFSFFQHSAKSSVFYNLGCTKPGQKEIYPIHTKKFEIDENCLKVGMQLQYELARTLLDRTE